MNALEKMTDLKSRSRTTLEAMQTYSREMLLLSIEYLSAAVRAFAPSVDPISRTLVIELDAHDSPASNDRMLEAFKTQWVGLQITEIVFDKKSNKFLLFTT